jgi:hypothetical protein
MVKKIDALPTFSVYSKIFWGDWLFGNGAGEVVRL